MNNIPPEILDKIGKNLYRDHKHPLYLMKEKVYDYFDDLPRIEIDSPIISTEYNFDKLKIHADHRFRSPDYCFYKSDREVLRTHMTSYLYSLALSNTGHSKIKYIICGDVYRKTIIDATHFPIFHQIDAFHVIDNSMNVEQDLRNRLKGLIASIFGEDFKYTLLEDNTYYPFTINSLKIKMPFKLKGKIQQLEVIGAGTVHPEIMKDLNLEYHKSWAFGINLDLLAMIYYNIKDIKKLWRK